MMAGRWGYWKATFINDATRSGATVVTVVHPGFVVLTTTLVGFWSAAAFRRLYLRGLSGDNGGHESLDMVGCADIDAFRPVETPIGPAIEDTTLLSGLSVLVPGQGPDLVEGRLDRSCVREHRKSKWGIRLFIRMD